MSFIKNFLQNVFSEKNSQKPTSGSKLISALQNVSHTENGALTHKNSNNPLVDLFFLAGSSRNIEEKEIFDLISKAWQKNDELTLKIIFWAGDVRGGAGERRFFRLALKWLENEHPKVLIKNIQAQNIQFFNRWDSLFDLTENTNVQNVVLAEIESGLENQDGLLAKWLPRKKQYKNLKQKIQKYLKINDQQYRKLVVHLSKTVEQEISKNNWQHVDYQTVPSQAFNKYRQAFLRHDENRFNQFIEMVNKGEAKINASVLYPHQLYQAYNQAKDENSIIAQWNNLPNYLENSTQKILPVCDVSGSMLGLPMDVCVSLGIYISERNEGMFKNAFVTFSQSPKIQYLQGNLVERISQLQTTEWGMNTDLYNVFTTVLSKAVDNKITESEMPNVILILSDMQFDQAVSGQTNLESIQQKYKQKGYAMPKIVFWNLNGKMNNSPALNNDENVALISGFSPNILETILSGNIQKFTPENVMLEAIQNERYARISL